MPIFNLFSKRQKALRGETPDLYTYDIIPRSLKVQIVHILRDVIGKRKRHNDTVVNNAYEVILDTLCREYGVFQLYGHGMENSDQITNFLITSENIDQVIDVIEISFKYVDTV